MPKNSSRNGGLFLEVRAIRPAGATTVAPIYDFDEFSLRLRALSSRDETGASIPSKAVLQCKELRLELRERAAEFFNLLFGAVDL